MHYLNVLRTISAFLALLMAGLICTAEARAAECIDDMQMLIGGFTLPTTPVGPSWTLEGYFKTYYMKDRLDFSITVWRRPCGPENKDAQVVFTADHRGDGKYFVGLKIEQYGDVFDVPWIYVGDALPSGSPYQLFYPSGGKPVSGIPNTLPCCLDHRAAFDLVFDVSIYGEIVEGPTRRIHVPAYTGGPPIEIGMPGGKIDKNTTGSWYNPSQSGHGLSVEVVSQHDLLANWYVFDKDGNPMWLVASGHYHGNEAWLDAYTADGPGAGFPPNFNASRVESEYWGDLYLRFSDCRNGMIEWSPIRSTGLNDGNMPLTRLTLPVGLACD